MTAHPALRSALAGGVAALLVGIMGFPQPFLAVIGSQLFLLQPALSWPRWLQFFLTLAVGGALGSTPIMALPQQPWVALPLATLLLVGGVFFFLRHAGIPWALIFSMGFVASFGPGIIVPGGFLPHALAHLGSLTLAFLSAVLARTIFSTNESATATPHVESKVVAATAFTTGAAALSGWILGALLFPHSIVPLSIAVVATSVGLWPLPAPDILRQRLLGTLLGGVMASTFLILISGSGNNLAVFLGGLALVLGAIEGCARHPKMPLALWRQAAAVFAVAAPMFPRPLVELEGVLTRIAAIWTGFFLTLLWASAWQQLKKARAPEHSDSRALRSPCAK
jgi:hypothetical protein